MQYPEEYIKTYLNLPFRNFKKKLLGNEMTPFFDLGEPLTKRIPESIQEFHIGEVAGIVNASKFQEILYDRKGRQTIRLSFGKHDSAFVEELWKFDYNDCLVEYFKRYLSSEAEFTTFKYNKIRKIEKIIVFSLDDTSSRFTYLFEYNNNGLLTFINCYDVQRTLIESTILTYNSNSKLTSKKTSDENKKLAEEILYTYNEDDLLSIEVCKNHEGQQKYKNNYSYDIEGRLKEKSSKFENKGEITSYFYEKEFLIGKSQKYITEKGIMKSNEWLADTNSFTIIEKIIQQNLILEKKTEYDEDWLPQKGIVNNISKEENSYEFRFRVTVHD